MLPTITGNVSCPPRGTNTVCHGHGFPYLREEDSAYPNGRHSRLAELQASHTASAVPGGFFIFTDDSCGNWVVFDHHKSHTSYRTNEAKTAGKCLEFEAFAHHQSSIIK